MLTIRPKTRLFKAIHLVDQDAVDELTQQFPEGALLPSTLDGSTQFVVNTAAGLWRLAYSLGDWAVFPQGEASISVEDLVILANEEFEQDYDID